MENRICGDFIDCAILSHMQKIATTVFIYASVAFGIVGILLIWVGGPDGNNPSALNQLLHNLLLTAVFIILPSFALSVASKYLNGKS